MVLQAEWKQIGDRVSQLIARAWLEPEFKERLLADPKGTLETEGIPVPEGVGVKIDPHTYHWSIGSHPDSPNETVWTIPLPPKPADIAEEQLSAWTSGNLSTNASVMAMMPNCC